MFGYSVQKKDRKKRSLRRRQERLTYEVVAGDKSLFRSPHMHTHTFTHTLRHSSLVFEELPH